MREDFACGGNYAKTSEHGAGKHGGNGAGVNQRFHFFKLLALPVAYFDGQIEGTCAAPLISSVHAIHMELMLTLGAIAVVSRDKVKALDW